MTVPTSLYGKRTHFRDHCFYSCHDFLIASTPTRKPVASIIADPKFGIGNMPLARWDLWLRAVIDPNNFLAKAPRVTMRPM
jgi:hypothetical protein